MGAGACHTFIRGRGGSKDEDLKIPQIIFRGLSTDSWSCMDNTSKASHTS